MQVFTLTLPARHQSVLIGLATLFAVASTPADAATNYVVKDLGGLGSGYTRALALNNHGQVVGGARGPLYSYGAAERPFLYSNDILQDILPDGGPSDLYGWGTALDINDSGVIVGASGSAGRAFVQINGVTTVLPTHGRYSRADSVNESGVIGGWDEGSLYTYSNEALTPLPEFDFPYALSSIGDVIVNDNGAVIGMASSVFSFTGSDSIGWLFVNGAYQKLGSLGGSSTNPADLNNLAQVVGWSQLGNGETHAFVSGVNGGPLRDLGTLGGTSSYAYGINESGVVVGSASLASGRLHAFVTDEGGSLIDLNGLVSLPEGVYLTEARDINELGQIVANDNRGHAYLLTVVAVPEPGTAGLLLAGLAVAWAASERGRRSARKR